jgi:hypothetical protein
MKKQTFVCLECGKTFQKYACLLSNPERTFCSKQCVGKAKRHGSTLHCAMCDSEFYRRFGEQDLDVRKNQFCSKECYQEWRSLYRKADTYIKVGSRHLHRIIAEQILGRSLTKDEVIHHMDEDKHNNHPSNLALLPDQAFHAKVHFGEVSDEDLRRLCLG